MNSRFCWRWAKRNHDEFRVLTIEDSNEIQNNDSNSVPFIKPSHFKGTGGYEQELTDHFSWRIMKFPNGHEFKVLTIE